MYGEAPQIVGQFDINLREMMFYMCLPVKMRHLNFPVSSHRVPTRLWPVIPLIDAIPREEMFDRYVYLTVKRLFVTPEYKGQRPGWHCDGFGTDDITYLWCDALPTEFCVQPFELSPDDQLSLKQMEEQANPARIRTYAPGTLLRLTERVVHRTSPAAYEGMRTFVKISLSRDQWALEGNSHNHLFDYDWLPQERSATRNMEHGRNQHNDSPRD